MAFNPFNLFKGNPRVLELMTADRGLDQLLLEESFPSQFKKSDNEALQAYMNYERYAELITYITTIDCNDTDKNRAYRFPYVASEVLAVNNQLTYKFLLEEVVFTEETLEEETDVQKEVDSESSDRSYSSIKSNNSTTPKKQPSENKPYVQADKENFVLRQQGDKTLSEMDLREITADDFPQARGRRVVVVRQRVRRTVKKPFEPLVFRLLRFFAAEVVHILDGYVCRVLESIINNRLQAFLAIVDKYAAYNHLKRILAHLQSTSVQEFLLTFITRLQESEHALCLAEELRFTDFMQRICEITPAEWPQEETVLEEKAYILGLYCSILEKINSKLMTKLHPEGQDKPLPLNSLVKEVMQVLNKNHVNKVIGIATELALATIPQSTIMGKIVMHYGKLAKLLLKAYCLLREAGDEPGVREMIQTCEECFDPIIPGCFAFLFENYLHEEEGYRFRNSLLGKMQFLEVLGVLAKEDVYFARRSMIEHPLFAHLLDLMQLHPNSSILHNAILSILSPFLTLQTEPLLIDKLFHKTHLLAFLFRTVKADSELRYEKRERIRKCFMAQITALCLAIEKLPTDETESLSEYKQSYEWQFIHQCLIEDEKGLRRKVLGGHEKLRDRKPLIFFSKEQCLDHYRHFLSGLKLTLFDDFENYDPANSDSEDEKEREERMKGEVSTEATVATLSIVQAPPEDDSKYFSEDYVL